VRRGKKVGCAGSAARFLIRASLGQPNQNVSRFESHAAWPPPRPQTAPFNKAF